MQLALPFAAAGTVVLIRNRRARRYILRVLQDGTVRVTMPRWGARRDALDFVERSRSWIEQQRQARDREAARDRLWLPGTHVLVDGRPARLDVNAIPGGTLVMVGDVCVSRRTGMPTPDLRPLVEGWLRGRARCELPAALMALAGQHGVTVTRVSIRNQRSRWGACSPRGTITLNWRLVQVPFFVREYVMLHELMHRRELNHSRRFWRHVAQVCPRYREAREWLLTEGSHLF